MAQRLKRLPAMWETWVRSLGREDPLEKEMAIHSSILAWRIPWTEDLGGLQSMGCKESDMTERLHFKNSIPICLFRQLPFGLLVIPVLLMTFLMWQYNSIAFQLQTYLGCPASDAELLLSADLMLSIVSRGRWRTLQGKGFLVLVPAHAFPPVGSCVVQDTQRSSPPASLDGTFAGTFPMSSLGAPAGL